MSRQNTLCHESLLLGYYSYTQKKSFPSSSIFTEPKRNWTQRQPRSHHTLTHQRSHARTRADEYKSFIKVQSTIITIIKQNLTGNKPLLTREACVSSDHSHTDRFFSDPLITASVSMCSYLHVVCFFTLVYVAATSITTLLHFY